MAAKEQGPPRLIPVHGDVQPYKYSSSYTELGGGLILGADGGGGGGSALLPALAVVERRQQNVAQEPAAAERPPLEDTAEDFMSLDVEPAAAQVRFLPSWLVRCLHVCCLPA